MDRVVVLSASALLLLLLVGASAKPQSVMVAQEDLQDADGKVKGVEIPVQVVPGRRIPLPSVDIQVEPEFSEEPAPGQGLGGSHNDPDRNEETLIEGDPSSGVLLRQEVIEDEGPNQVMSTRGYGGRYWDRPRPTATSSVPYYGRYNATPWYWGRNPTTGRDWGWGGVTDVPQTATTRRRWGWGRNVTFVTTSVPRRPEPEPECRCVCRRGGRRPRVTTSPPEWEYDNVRADAVWERMMSNGTENENATAKAIKEKEKKEKEEKDVADKKKKDKEEGRKELIVIGIVVMIIAIVICIVFILRILWKIRQQRKAAAGVVVVVAADDGGPSPPAPVRSGSGSGGGAVQAPTPAPIVQMPLNVEGTSAGSS